MAKNQKENQRYLIASLFLIIPTLLLFVGYFLNPFPPSRTDILLLQIPMFLGLLLLLFGFFLSKIPWGSLLKLLGWVIFGVYWSFQPEFLYLSEEGDIFNAVVCIIGVYVLFYLAYQEWISYNRNEKISCLTWIAGASSLAGLIYFVIERTGFAPIMIEEVARQSGYVLDLIIGNANVIGSNIWLDGNYAVTIIFACTAIQAMVLFIGMIVALPTVGLKRKLLGLIITLIPIYILNLFRNAMVAFLVGRNIADFNLAHNVLSKIGALATLIVLLYFLIKLIPEIFDEIICLTDLYKRDGPLEKIFKGLFRGKK